MIIKIYLIKIIIALVHKHKFLFQLINKKTNILILKFKILIHFKIIKIKYLQIKITI
jgi:hypothetical protein